MLSLRVYLSSALAGLLFSLGLGLSGMMNPQKVQGFLDLTGRWDPSLALVMGGALVVSGILFPLVLKRPHPLWGAVFSLPVSTKIDRPLLLGAALFGTGWAISGVCPGPALANAATGQPGILLFVGAMMLGFLIQHRLQMPDANYRAVRDAGIR